MFHKCDISLSVSVTGQNRVQMILGMLCEENRRTRFLFLSDSAHSYIGSVEYALLKRVTEFSSTKKD